MVVWKTQSEPRCPDQRALTAEYQGDRKKKAFNFTLVSIHFILKFSPKKLGSSLKIVFN